MTYSIHTSFTERNLKLKKRKNQRRKKTKQNKSMQTNKEIENNGHTFGAIFSKAVSSEVALGFKSS